MATRLTQWIAHTRTLLDQEHNEEIAQRNRLLSSSSSTSASTPTTSSSSLTTTSRRKSKQHFLLPLDISKLELGYFGRMVVTLERHGGKAVAKPGESRPRLPPHNITTGDIVLLRPVGSHVQVDTEGNLIHTHPTGVVKRVTDFFIEIIFDDDVAAEHDDILQSHTSMPLRVDSLGNTVTHKRLLRALTSLEKMKENNPSSRLVRVCTGAESSMGVTSSTTDKSSSSKLQHFVTLNSSQQKAVHTALSSKDVCVIHGPPGTGKTTTLVEIIRQLVAQDLKVLAVAPSNVAVDNLAERLAVRADGQERALKLIRVGHPARVNVDMLQHTMEAVVSRGEEADVVVGIRQEMKEHLHAMARLKSSRSQKSKGGKRSSSGSKSDWKEKRIHYDALRLLRKDLRKWEEMSKIRALQRADVILSTTIGCAGRDLAKTNAALRKTGGGGGGGGGGGSGGAFFDVVVIDEAAQALEAECWIPMLMGMNF